MMPTSWRSAIASSIVLHVTFFCLFAVVLKQKGELREGDYIPVELIIPSGNSPLAAASSVRPRTVPPREEPAPEPSEPQEQLAEAVTGAVENIPDLSDEAPHRVQAPGPGSPGIGADNSPEGSGYQPFHAVSKIPYFRTQVKPAYPLSERAAGVEARVIVEVFISSHGAVDRVEVVKSGGRRFDEAVIAAVKDSSFEPGYLEGRPVPVRVQIPYTFKLR